MNGPVTKTSQRLLVGFLLGAALLNAAWALRQYYHWPVFAVNDWMRMERDLLRARTVLNDLPQRHVEYRVEDVSETYDAGAYYKLQYILVPTILQYGPVENGYVLVQFWATRQARPLPDLIMIEDFGNGLALYRTSS